MAKKRSFWDILAWICFGIVVLYFLLKILGVLKSPISIDIVALISGSYFIGKFVQKIDNVSKDVEDIKVDIKEINQKCPIFKEKGTKTK